MPDRIIFNSDFYNRIKHYRGLGYRVDEIAKLMNIDPERVRKVIYDEIQPVDRDGN